jgi:hypothetical protein
MLSVTVKYQPAVEAFTAEKKNNLHKYELSEEEWEITEQTCEVLKVCACLF